MVPQYKILWVEDYPMSIRRIKTELEKHIAERGFSIEDEAIKVINDIDQFEYIINNSLSDYNLILIAFDLGQIDIDETVLLKIIKTNKELSSKTVLYSSQYDNLQNQLQANHIEHLKTSTRDELLYMLKKIITATVKT